ncbi:sn-glycerol 3-phosphate transport system ATP-binding protein [Neorhizobium sp. 2083]|uniref:sn-glycerol-3-phosphate import ATP-binding protein UgpC n=1 Tax=Neorhizobium sp. 2083 TaxID=2817762 RepID=UPI0028650023|nr:sn-glycerol-3-phosphate import ATP-binding protein UgpC [Neorhizobium sp. 2083]MDR6817672.1 sn-glycerol 3-phosphate transport system ATP-binding protein [Neorhizobium sp. 2083]
MARIELKDVRKVYGGNIEAIKGVSLDIEDGEMIVLVGPSGCGKSTLLRMVAGLEGISSGEVTIADKRVNELEPAERDIAMVFQNYALYPHMTVRQNLAYGLRNRNTPKDEIDRRITEAARALEIEPFLERKPRQLSGGQRQRVAMGRAIVRKPAAFLFDEPLSNLDAKLRVQMRVEIRRLQRSLATTSIYVTHDQMEAMTLADRLVVLNAGRIEQVGTPIELYEKPATTFVATFIGSPSMNLMKLGQDSGWKMSADGQLPKGAATIGIRPEDIVIANGHAPGPVRADVQVAAVELVGAESYVHALTADASPVVFRVAGRSGIQIGDSMGLTADPSRFHLFDAAGRRV